MQIHFQAEEECSECSRARVAIQTDAGALLLAITAGHVHLAEPGLSGCHEHMARVAGETMAAVHAVMEGRDEAVAAKSIELGDHGFCCDRSGGGGCFEHRALAAKLRIIRLAFGAERL